MEKKRNPKNNKYWERRQVEAMFQSMEQAELKADEIARIYFKASTYLSLKIDKIFERYKRKHGLSEEEARMLLSLFNKLDSKERLYQRLTSASYNNKEEILRELEAPAYQARIERLYQLYRELDTVMRTVYAQELKQNTDFYTGLAKESYYRTIFDVQQRIGYGFSFSKINAKTIRSVMEKKWSGKNYSKRIWGNTKQLSNVLKEELLINFLVGRTNREVEKIIQDKFSQSARNARRLIRTESNYISSELVFEAYNTCGVKRYRFLATLDLRTSILCQGLDGKIFLVSKRKIGKNCNPMHPWCRSTTIPVIDEKVMSNMLRAATDPKTGKHILVPSSMTYKEWYMAYVQSETKNN